MRFFYSPGQRAVYIEGLHPAIPRDSRVFPQEDHEQILSALNGGDDYIHKNFTITPQPTALHILNDDGAWRVPEHDFGKVLDGVLSTIRAEKSRIKNGGFMVAGTLFDSDDAAQVAYMLYASKVETDPAYIVEDWKASTGQWVRMDATLFSQVSAALETHLADCFAWQQAKEAEINACTTEEQLTAVSLVYGE